MKFRLKLGARPCIRPTTCLTLKVRGVMPIRAFGSSESQRTTVAVPATTSQRLQLPIDHIPATKPPSARPVEDRKSQMIRTYTSLLRTTPLILFFQHSNLTAEEWAAVRRELKSSLEAVMTASDMDDFSKHIHLQVLRTNMMKVALKLVELYNPEVAASSGAVPRTSRGPLVHDLSQSAYDMMKKTEAPVDSAFAQLEPLLVGPIAALVFPAMSPAHVAASLRVLSPTPGTFPAPTRKKHPGYHDPICQNALSKLILVGGRVEGQVFDQAGIHWVGNIQGGMDGLRAQLVNILQGAGLGITSALEGNSKSLWLALQSRREMLDNSGHESVDQE